MMRDRRFLGYLGACFVNAFNDNAFKVIVSLTVLRSVTEESGGLLISLVYATFIIPFLIFSSWAGDLADKYSKRTVVVVMQAYEIFAMLLAAFAFYIGDLPLVLAALFWSGVQSAFYSPGKYGILPESIANEDLSRANGILQGVTNVAILIGTAFGGFALTLFGGSPVYASVACAAFASIGVLFAIQIWRVAPADPLARIGWLNPFGSVFRTLGKTLPDRRIGAPMVGLAFFYFLGAMMQIALLLLVKNVLYAGFAPDFVEARITYFLIALTIGIGLGSLLAGRWSGPKVEVGLVPLGALGTAFFLLDLGFFATTGMRAGIDIFMLGLFAGLFAVPLQAAVQARAPANERGGVIAGSNFLTFAAILAASGVLPLMEKLGFDPKQIMIALGIMTLVAGIGLCVWLAEFFIRFVMWLLTHTVYDITIRGRENVPERGPALFIANHVSFADAILIASCMQRLIRFLMISDYYENWLFRPFCRLMKAIPITPGRDSKDALLRAASELKEGHIVCIFAEGAITRTGNLLAFRKGFEAVARESGAPIIPVYLGGVWGSIFSFERGRFIWKWPRRLPYPVTISFGRPLPSSATPFEVRQAVMELGSDEMRNRVSKKGSLGSGFLRAVRRRWSRQAVADSMGRTLSYGRLMAVSWLFGKHLPPGEHIGIVLPPSVVGAIVNIAVTFRGRIPVNLNFTASGEAISSAIEQCRIKHVITSRAFREKVKCDLSPTTELFVEDLISKIPKWKILAAELLFRPIPLWILRRIVLSERHADDVATVIFSSGSTGLPKGVVLTHGNVRANIEGLAQVFDVRPTDRILGALPLFHSFGFSTTFWFPLVAGFGAIYHPNPLDPKGIGKIAAAQKATFLVTTPTFAGSYLRKIEPEKLSSLRLTFVGAEKLPDELGRAWEEKFGSPLLEGYGATECAPVISVNIPGQNKRGTVGHPLPGVVVRVVGENGMLEVKGPNVMKGYLGDPDRTADVLKDGWYTTGDIATLDRDGYIKLMGRLSRFSKIAGEMVPHGRIEEALLKAIGETERTPVAVTGLPDPEKGERLVVLYAVDGEIEKWIEALKGEGFPNLWIPRRENFIRVDAIPILGTGKLDLQAVRMMASTEKGTHT